MATTAVRCARPGCEVASSGACADGHVPAEACPHFGKDAAPAPEDDGESEPEATSHEEPRVRLNSGEVLRADAMASFLAWRPVTRVSIIGESFSGKTTLVCALYDRYLRGPFADRSFIGSRSLIALERRIYPSRIAAGLPRPDTPRTSIQDGLVYFHFALTDTRRGRVDLMLSDRAGETYRRARVNPSQLSTLPELTNCDRLVLLMDGGKIADPIERAGAMQAIRQMLRGLADNVAGCDSIAVQIVTTKVDLIALAADRDALGEQVVSFKDRLNADLAPRFAALSFWEIAARDPLAAFAPAHGLAELLLDWLTPPCAPAARPGPLPPLETEYDRLLLRIGG